MPIELTCSCGKRLQAANECAGRQGQCPACGSLLLIPERDATVPASSPEATQAPSADPGGVRLLGPGGLDHAVTPSAGSATDSPAGERHGRKEDDNAQLTGVGCVLTFLTVAVIFAVALPIVRWRDPETGEPLPRTVAIFSPILIGAVFHGIGMLFLRLIGLRVWSTQEKDEEK
jgi:hypothetical protein